MGGRVSEREVRDLLGLAEPGDGEAVLGAAPAGGQNPIAALLGQGGAAETEEAPDEQAPKVVAVRKKRR